MNKNKGFTSFAIILAAAVLLTSAVSAFQFNGTVRDINGNAINNSLVNITVRSMNDFSIVGYNTTTTNATGWFNLSVDENAQWMYEPKITWQNTTDAVNANTTLWIGQSLPAFPQEMLTQVAGTTFYLKEAGTINITAINSSGQRIPFNYQLKDQKLGYSIAVNFDSHVSETVLTVPRGRNYSLMIYPNQSMPVSFDWNNFTAGDDYDVNTLSTYNTTTKTLAYQFNTTLEMKRVSGYLDYGDVTGWDEFNIIAYLLEPGNMVGVEYGMLPNNLSSALGETDVLNKTSGFYNISLPGTVETSSVILFATAVNGTLNIGAVKNISLSTESDSEINNLNFTNPAGMLGAFSNVSPTSISGPPINMTLSKQNFTILNASNSTLTNINGHIEVTVDYSSLGAVEFTWMTSIAQGSASSFLVPLLNSTGIKELNAFVGGGDYAPVRKSYTAAQLLSPPNITLNSFNPNAIDSALAASSITMELYISNSTCDIPNSNETCLVGGSSQDMETFNPMGAIMGGGKLSFRMGTGNISVHYVNVDMIASGPPDALFDSSTSESTSDNFESALRFGSGGPTIYDYILISMPYTEGSSTTTGLNESAQINISIPLFYDDDWNIIWNGTSNGTNATDLAGNYSHYSTRQSEWATLLNQTICTSANITSALMINSTNPCYVDKINNKIWVRLPHFSGTGPSVTGNLVTAAASSDSPSSGGGGGGSSASTYTISTTQLTNGYQQKLGVNDRIRFKINDTQHTAKIAELTTTTAVINVSSTTQQKTFTIGQTHKFDVDDDREYDIQITLDSIVSSKATITIEKANGTVVATPQAGAGATTDRTTTGDEANEGSLGDEKTFSTNTWWTIGIIIAIIIIFVIAAILIVKYQQYSESGKMKKVKVFQNSPFSKKNSILSVNKRR